YGAGSWAAVLKSVALVMVIVAIWVGILVLAMGGIGTFLRIMLDYGVDQSRAESLVLGSSILAWLRQINRLVIWNRLAVISWVWALPFFFRNRDRLPIGSQTAFMLVWLVPGLTLQALIHIGAPGHTLFSVPALCVLGGYVLSFIRGRDLVLASALIFNVMLFLDYFPLPAGVNESLSRGAPSIKNAMLFGTFESSLGQVRWLDDITRTPLKEIEEFTPSDRPSLIITTDTYVDQWFMNWRIGRYYLPKEDFWILYDGEKRRVEHIRHNVLLEMRDSIPLRVPIFREGRILWLI